MAANASSKSSNEAAEVIVDRIENYVLVLQDDLNNLVEINRDLRTENRKKDSLIESKGAYLKSLRDVAVADVQQLEFGTAAAEEDLSFQCNVLHETIAVLKMKRQRQLAIEEDNKRQKVVIERTEAKLRKDRLEHANDIHILNKRMQQIRRQMEKTLKVQLTEMDLAYKQRSFAALSERQKAELLTNAQMKEEKGLQDAGMLTIQVRMRQQDEGMNAMKTELRLLHDQEETIRTKLGELFEAKFRATNEFNALKQQESELLETQHKIWMEIDSPPTMEALRDQIEACEDDTEREQLWARMWYTRLCRLKQLETDLRPVSVAEKAGYYTVANFPLAPIQFDRDVLSQSEHDFADNTPYSSRLDTARSSANCTPRVINGSRLDDMSASDALQAVLEADEDAEGDKDEDEDVEVYMATGVDEGADGRTAAEEFMAPYVDTMERARYASSSSTPTAPTDAMYALKLSHLNEAQRRDRALFAALRPLHGREGVLLSGPKPIPLGVGNRLPYFPNPPRDLLGTGTGPTPYPDRADSVEATHGTGTSTRSHLSVRIDSDRESAEASPMKSSGSQKGRKVTSMLSKRGSLMSLLNCIQQDHSRDPSHLAQNMIAWTVLEIAKIWQQTRDKRLYVEDDEDETLSAGGEEEVEEVVDEEAESLARRAALTAKFAADEAEAEEEVGTDDVPGLVHTASIQAMFKELADPCSGFDVSEIEDMEILKQKPDRKFSFTRQPSAWAWKLLQDEIEREKAEAELEASEKAKVEAAVEEEVEWRAGGEGAGGTGGGNGSPNSLRGVSLLAPGSALSLGGVGGEDEALSRSASTRTDEGRAEVPVLWGDLDIVSRPGPTPPLSHFSSPAATPRGLTMASPELPSPTELAAIGSDWGYSPLSSAFGDDNHSPMAAEKTGHPLLVRTSPGSKNSSGFIPPHESPMGVRAGTFLSHFERDCVPDGVSYATNKAYQLAPPLKVKKAAEAHFLVKATSPPPSLAALAGTHRRTSGAILPWGTGAGALAEGGASRQMDGHQRPTSSPSSGLSSDAELDLQDVLRRHRMGQMELVLPLGVVAESKLSATVQHPSGKGGHGSTSATDPLASAWAIKKLVMSHALTTPGAQLYMTKDPRSSGTATGTSTGRGGSSKKHPSRDPLHQQHQHQHQQGRLPASYLKESRVQFTSQDKMTAVRKEIAHSKFFREDLHHFARGI